MLQTSARLLRLLSLLEARRDWTGPQLAERLGVTTRTVRNDIERLRGLGYPVDATPGVRGGYRLGLGATLPPLLLDDDEAVAVTIGLRTAARGAVAGIGIGESSVRALAKLERLLPSRLRRRVGTVAAAMGTLPDPATWRYRARVTVRATAEQIADRLPAAITVEPAGQDTCVIDAGSDTPQMLALHLSLLDADFAVDESAAPELAECLRTLSARYARAAGSYEEVVRAIASQPRPRPG
jgi:biotin operon repressor